MKASQVCLRPELELFLMFELSLKARKPVLNPNEPVHSRGSELLNETQGTTHKKRYWSHHIEGGGHEANFSLFFILFFFLFFLHTFILTMLASTFPTCVGGNRDTLRAPLSKGINKPG